MTNEQMKARKKQLQQQAKKIKDNKQWLEFQKYWGKQIEQAFEEDNK